MKGMVKNEKGFVLILALVTMVAMTVIGLSIIMNLTMDTQLSRNELESKTAFQLAEAGVNEAIARLHLSSVNTRYIGETLTEANNRVITWNENNSLGRDFGYNVGGTRNSADNLNYSVTIRYLDERQSGNPEGYCDSNDNVSPNTAGNASTYPTTWDCVNATPEVAMYGRDFKVPDTLTRTSYGKLPIYRITSTGTVSSTTRTIVAYAGGSSLNTDTEYGINTNGCVDANGMANNLGEVKQGPSCGCDPQITGSCATNKTQAEVDTTYNMNTYLGDTLAAIIPMADEKHSCKNITCSAPGDDIPSSGALDTVITDWGDATGDTYSTMIYIDNSGGKDVSLTGNYTGRGILIVSGNLTLSGNFVYEGLVYVLGTLTMGGGGSTLNVTGGIMANNTVTAQGNITVAYDQPTLLAVARENSSSAIVVWKRL